MAVGLSVVVKANFDTTKTSSQKRSVNATPSDNMRTSELEIGAKKTSLLMTEDNVKSKTTLLGFYYFYAK